MGIITPIGLTTEDVWAGVLAAHSPVHRITRFDASAFSSQIAAEVPDFDFREHTQTRRPGRLDRFSQFAIVAAGKALAEATLEPEDLMESEAAVYVGSALGGIAYGEEQHERYLTSGIRSVAPSLALSVFAGAGATNISIHFGLRGPAISNANSCASGAIAIGEALHLVRGGGADIALAGGVECPLAPLTYGSFCLIKAMSKSNEAPSLSCRPFDRARDGFVMGEGAAILVLEEWSHAVDRGARIQAELLGYATTNDAHHMTIPRPDGKEAARAMRLALEDASVEPKDIDSVNAHATGTPLGDAAEAAALHSVFPDMPPVSATKPLHGHALGASPAIEAAISVLALQNHFLPGIVNLTDVDPSCWVNHVAPPGQPFDGRTILSNSFGFGGINASLVIGQGERNGHVRQ